MRHAAPGEEIIGKDEENDMRFMKNWWIIAALMACGSLLTCDVFAEQASPQKAIYKVKFYRGDYKERQQKAIADGAVCYVEQHFNATEDPVTNYTMVLITDTASAFTRSWAQYYADTLSEKLSLKKGYDNGIKLLKDGDRGYGNLRHSAMPAILLEPFFLSNPTGLSWASSKRDLLAETLVESIHRFFPQGGLVAFSVGHRYKTSRPDDRGAGPYGGVSETELIEPVMEQAARILDPSASLPSEENKARYSPVFDELCRTVAEHFYNPDFVTNEFPPLRERCRQKATNSSCDREFSSTVNAMLSEFHTSHTAYYTKDDASYYQLASIFKGSDEVRKIFGEHEILYPATGLLTRELEGKTFVVSVLAGSAAEQAGILRGDEIVASGEKNFLTMEDFKGKDGLPLKIRRTRKEEPFAVKLAPPMVDPSKEFLEAQQKSVKIFDEGRKKVGYVHIWSFAGDEYYKALCDALVDGALKDTDGLILDLREGWGGASPSYLGVFNRDIPLLVMIDRKGARHTFDSVYRKPVVVLINGRSRSGKELLAYGFKKYGLGTLIGEKTAGATMAGRVFALSDGSLLFLAVCATRIDGEELEGKGVAPDIEVPQEVRYSGGEDRQLRRALEWMRETLK
ncbi:MAG: S41 family peptidase [Candidatus Eremiobacteraeota bacterium]|nr:S41 family peptidase [Candidatus Eremiobacteraeota bacterium]